MTSNPFIEGAITVSKVLSVMTLNDSMDSAAFEVYVSKCLVPQLWKGAVVVMDNLPAHKVKAIGREANPLGRL
jgi:transposase